MTNHGNDFCIIIISTVYYDFSNYFYKKKLLKYFKTKIGMGTVKSYHKMRIIKIS